MLRLLKPLLNEILIGCDTVFALEKTDGVILGIAVTSGDTGKGDIASVLRADEAADIPCNPHFGVFGWRIIFKLGKDLVQKTVDSEKGVGMGEIAAIVLLHKSADRRLAEFTPNGNALLGVS